MVSVSRTTGKAPRFAHLARRRQVETHPPALETDEEDSRRLVVDNGTRELLDHRLSCVVLHRASVIGEFDAEAAEVYSTEVQVGDELREDNDLDAFLGDVALQKLAAGRQD